MSWRPILEGASATRARAAIEAILAATEQPGWSEEHSMYGLVEGQASTLLLAAYAARGGLVPVDLVAKRACEVAENARSCASGPYLWHGIAGIAWTLDHVATICEQPVELDANIELDDGLLELLALDGLAFETLRGAAGLVVYAEPRVGATRGRELIGAVVRSLAASATVDGAHAHWRTKPNLISKVDRELHPDGYVSTGIAHGIGGPIAALGIACRERIETEVARPLLINTLEWLWTHELAATENRQLFPALIGEKRGAVRGGWCYGDIGLASVVDAAARAADLPVHQALSLALARDVAGRPLSRANLDNPMFCHGTSGLAHMLNRWFQQTGDPVFRDAACDAFEQTLAMREPSRGAGGFSSIGYGDDGPVHFTQYGLLDGSVGVALALLAAVTDIEPGWDRPFMLG